MLRVIGEVQHSISLERDEQRCAFFFFEKAQDSSKGSLSVETCLRSLVKQLAWNSASLEVDFVVETKYQEIQRELRSDNSLTSGECLQLLEHLIAARATYIMIDGIDECEDPICLLRALKQLILQNNQEANRTLHLMVSGRSDLPVLDFFKGCLRITTTGGLMHDD